ncbi:MAG: tetratricopeptide repeat protein [Anaeromyxobacter sp.]
MATTTPRTALAAAALLALAACAHGPSPKDRRAAEIHHDLGVEALRAGRSPADALKEFDAALELDPGFADAHRGRGLVLDFGFGRADEAEREYRRAIELKTPYPEAENDLGQLLAKRGRHEEALKHFDAALAEMTYREPWIARCNKGQALWQMGRKTEGIAEQRACLTLAPRFCKGRRELGRILLEDRRVAEAIEELSAYARTCEKTPDAHLQLGLARVKQGDLAGARESLQRCVELGANTVEGDECKKTLELLR